MTKKKLSKSESATSSSTTTTTTTTSLLSSSSPLSKSELSNVISRISCTILPQIDEHIHHQSHQYNHTTDSLDILSVKTSLLLSYLIDWTQLLRLCNLHDDINKEGVLERLNLMKVTLERFRPMERKLRYALDRLLSQSSTTTSTTTTTTTMTAHENKNDMEHPLKQQKEEEGEDDDPLNFAPNPMAMITNYQEEEESEDEDKKASEDEELKHAMQLTREGTFKLNHDNDDQTKSSSTKLYRAPRLTAMAYPGSNNTTPFTDDNDNNSTKEDQKQKRKLQRMKHSEILQTLRQQYTEIPEEDENTGGTTTTTTNTTNNSIDYRRQQWMERQKERIKYEENAMIRLTLGKKERKEQKQLQIDETNSLKMMSDLGHLAMEVTDAFENDNEEEEERSGGRFAASPGKRKRSEQKKKDDDDNGGVGEYGRRKQHKLSSRKGTNSFQRALYGSNGSNKKKKKGKR